MTFSLNNFPRNDTKFKVALQWETEFLKIVQEFQKNNANFDFAYMSEVKSKSVGEIFIPHHLFFCRLLIFPLLCLPLFDSVHWRMRSIGRPRRTSPSS